MSFSNRTAALFRSDTQLRTLLACIGVSIALHSLVLLGFPGIRTTTRSGAVTVLTAFFAARPAPVAPSLEKPPLRPKKPATEVRSAEPPAVLAQPAPAPVLSRTEVTPVLGPGAPREIAPAPPAVSPPAAEPGASPVAVAERSVGDGLDARLLEKYRLALIDAARRFRRYPPQAMDRGWQGRVEIRLVIDANGTIKNATIKTSSRYAILDEQALDMVKRGKSSARIPPALSGREFTVDVPVIFELRTG